MFFRYIVLTAEVKSHYQRKQSPQSRRLMIVCNADIIISAHIQNSLQLVKLCCVFAAFHCVSALSVLVL